MRERRGQERKERVIELTESSRHEPLLAGGTEIAGAPCGRCGAGRARPVVAAAGVVAAVWGVL
jgi:hypothetical protein